MYLFFDTETNGKAKSFFAPPTALDNWPRITQLAWQLYDKDEKLISERCDLIKPDGWTVPKEQFFIENNMSTERCEEFGIPLLESVSAMINDIERSEYMVAHNMKFDVNVLGAEFIRLKVKSQKKPEKICTMMTGTSYCKIPKARGGGHKWPTLTEMHVKLFGEGFSGAHDAMGDVLACAKSFFELKRVGHILKEEKQLKAL